MKCFVLALALLLPAPVFAQSAPSAIPGDSAAFAPPSAAMQQSRVLMEQYRLQTRQRVLYALTAQHRAAVANLVGQLALMPNPDPRAAAQQLDLLLSPAEKQSIVAIATAERANIHAAMRQRRAAFEATLTASQREQMTQRDAQHEAFMQQHPHSPSDPGAIVLRTLGNFGGAGMHGRGM